MMLQEDPNGLYTFTLIICCGTVYTNRLQYLFATLGWGTVFDHKLSVKLEYSYGLPCNLSIHIAPSISNEWAMATMHIVWPLA